MALASLRRASAAASFSRSAALRASDIGDVVGTSSARASSARLVAASASSRPSTPVLLCTLAGDDGWSNTRRAFSAMDAFRLSTSAAVDSSASRFATSAARASGSSSAALDSAARSPPALSSSDARYASPSTPRSSNASPSSKAGGGVNPLPDGPWDAGVVIFDRARRRWRRRGVEVERPLMGVDPEIQNVGVSFRPSDLRSLSPFA